MKIGGVVVLCRDSWCERLRCGNTLPGLKVLIHTVKLQDLATSLQFQFALPVSYCIIL
jgi:hypothetical protein